MKKVRIAGLSVLLSAVTMLTYMYALAHRNRVLTHTLYSTSTPTNKLNVFFISDIHKRSIPKRLIDDLRTRSIDAVIVGGDVAEGGVPIERIERNMRLLASIGPIFYVFGNNDQEVGTENILRVMKQVGGKVLVNSTTSIPNHPAFGICGLQDPNNGKVEIDKAVDSASGYDHLILAVHNPSFVRKFEENRQPDLSVAGHTHGGQIRLGPFGMQDLGCFETVGNRAKLISNGYGTTMVPLRFGAKPECHVVEVHY
ncbi:serine/threonine protein phosphatase [Sporosarcina sp. P18a]|uniref:metallophosphoesterase n=1 Tax=Sporosarcina sp. P18a TaxID=2048259 RepID=UPI000C16B5A5|nr:metallophosphoesterase [Sporosarcina sp. P18a]PIC81251.1 serine/threonine protein phosphatase [Sporosarcina sp. P18a]